MISIFQPKVSVVVPNYNHALFLRQRIDSVLRQTYREFEIILLDDCSTDDSRSLLSAYAHDPRVRIEFNDTNSGSGFRQWNKGVRLAHGEYVWIAESDDYADERLLEKLVARLDTEARAVFAYCRSQRVATDGRHEGFVDPWPFIDSRHSQHRWTADYCADGQMECREYMARCNTVPNASAVVFRKAAYQRVGGADEDLCLCGDWKLWAGMASTGKVMYIAEPLNYYRFHSASIRSITYGTGKDAAEIFQVRFWILDQIMCQQSNRNQPPEKCSLAKGYMDLAFDSYPDFPDVTYQALERVSKLGGTDYIPAFPTWKGELLKGIIGWKGTKRASRLYHRYRSQSRVR